MVVLPQRRSRMPTCAALAVLALVMVQMASSASAALYLGDSTDFDESALRYLPQGNMWQTFTAGWTSELGQVSVYLGTEDHCVESTATLYVAEGTPSSFQAVKNNAIGQPITITTTCDDDVVCVDKEPSKQCASWQRFLLETPITLQRDATYAFAIEVEPSDYNLLPVIGVSPSSKNHGGASSLAVSPLYKTRYAQYTFQTYVTNSNPGSANLDEQTVSSTESPDATNVGDSSNDSRNNKSGVGVAGIVVPVVLVIVVVVAIAFVVVQRRRWAKEKVIDGSQLYVIGPDEEEGAERNSLTGGAQDSSRPFGRHPINVRSAHQHGHEDRGRWADQSWAYGTYTRRLPSLPTETQC
ncbi:hypothetical protein PTSG_02151 [Salpingoeca rosetta]|uniref:Uncharacterized protein n=1 Tax=Salpingoeca rosetta (strain ATCC 50818 / BSB-021) TaxID=946362 RepID=F2U1C8_SALR5|nr:uncharacterized protein PTSG_02151 [Salpingoeca rosetta]EGD81430.1 hypothetical protein PTSG_02151 [Salpingoeca rosetta]|eukprot:XP_004996634.1 hypothetical protein PTSG_02151 [Salpingoeca rosetta]